MRIAVIAANGRSGKVFVEQALAAGHEVHAGIFGTNTLTPHPRLVAVKCNATNRVDLKSLLKGQQAVVSFIGHVKGSPPRVQTDAMKAVVGVMRSLKLTRIVSLTGTGVRFRGDRVTLVDRVLNLSIRLIDPARVRDGAQHVKVLKQSGLEWTVLRVLKLQNTKPTAFSLREHGPTKWYVSREEVAAAALEVLENHSFIGKAPILSPKE